MQKTGTLIIAILICQWTWGQANSIWAPGTLQESKTTDGKVAFGTERAQQLKAMSVEELEQIQPRSANPYLSFLPADVDPDYEYWDAYIAATGRERARQKINTVRATTLAPEVEPNNTFLQATPVSRNDLVVPTQTPVTGASDNNTTNPDIDIYAVPLVAGDTISIAADTVPGAPGNNDSVIVGLFDPETQFLGQSSVNATALHPASSPLFTTGKANFSYVIPFTGTYFVAIQVISADQVEYEMDIGAFRPILEN